ncbi:hypothetical protein BDQ17DRAFT_1327217 [Cyathus striatus]|nr:hypothetical protein BDQ17DRAFT_1327217 [Cyathus striatus]
MVCASHGLTFIITDDSSLNVTSVKDIGEITLQIHEVIVGDYVPVHERNTECISFSPEEKLNIKKKVREYYDLQKLVTFTFKYRPLEVLKADGIALRKCANKRKATDVNDKDGDTEEVEFLRARVRRLEARLSNAKRIKMEPRSAFLPGEIIDLTTTRLTIFHIPPPARLFSFFV